MVVVLREGDLTGEQAKSEEDGARKEEEEARIEGGKILFSKPKKRENSDNVQEDSCGEAVRSKPEVKKKKAKKEKKLLSFNEDEEDEG